MDNFEGNHYKLKMNFKEKHPQIVTPKINPPAACHDAKTAIDMLCQLYSEGIAFLNDAFDAHQESEKHIRYRAFYPQISMRVIHHPRVDSRLSFGHMTEPGLYATTITRPDLFSGYLREQIDLLLKNQGVPVEVGLSDRPIPMHFAASHSTHATATFSMKEGIRDIFDVPDLTHINDKIADGLGDADLKAPRPLALFSAERVDYSLARLAHYTATDPEHFQNFVLFTNYQFYVESFESYARAQLGDPESGYVSYVAPGNIAIFDEKEPVQKTEKTPQMPAYHLKREDGNGITLVNIGVGPSNAKTATDHIAVLRPHAWLMVGHCAGLRSSQALGDFVLAHAYVRDDKVLDADLPVWVPVPALAEIQIALEEAVADVTELRGYDLKRIMRTGTVASVDNRNWELRDNSGPIRRLSQSRAIALDMESATVAANGFRFRVPYGTLLCVSDKPLHGELKLPGMASDFYKTQVSRHLMIGIKAMEKLRKMPSERLQSRKLRSFDQPPFL